jgi:NAD(P)-dependent dehydrogenase (short-subunit alcohol dehydrogenase family)
MVNIIAVTGANSGLGKAICKEIERWGIAGDQSSIVLRINGPEAVVDVEADNIEWSPSCAADLTVEGNCTHIAWWIKQRTIEQLAKRGLTSSKQIYPVLINCAGVNYIDWFENADFAQFDRLMSINVRSGLELVQELIGRRPPIGGLEDENWFRGTGAVLNIVSNASHVPMTNSVFYNATKGAFHIATLALARELRKTHGLTVFGISPNKLAGTGMSDYIEKSVPGIRGWTPEQAQQYQLAALPAGEETDPATLAEFIAFLLSRPERHKYLTNTIIPYGA